MKRPRTHCDPSTLFIFVRLRPVARRRQHCCCYEFTKYDCMMVFKPAVRLQPLLFTNFLCRHYESRAAFVTVNSVSVHPFSGMSAKLFASSLFGGDPFGSKKASVSRLKQRGSSANCFLLLILFSNHDASLLRRLYLSSLSGIEGKRSRGSVGYADDPRNGERVATPTVSECFNV